MQMCIRDRCMQKGLVQGFSDGMIKPQGTFTRAEFAKLLTTTI